MQEELLSLRFVHLCMTKCILHKPIENDGKNFSYHVYTLSYLQKH